MKGKTRNGDRYSPSTTHGFHTIKRDRRDPGKGENHSQGFRAWNHPMLAVSFRCTTPVNLAKVFLRLDPAVQQFGDLQADRPGRRHVARVKGRTVIPAQVSQPGVPVEDDLHEGPVARSVPGGLAREGRPVAARYLFGLYLELQLAFKGGNGGRELPGVTPQQGCPGLC